MDRFINFLGKIALGLLIAGASAAFGQQISGSGGCSANCTFTGQTNVGNGTFSAPAITLGDVTAGWYRNSANQWTWTVGSVSTLSIFASNIRLAPIDIVWSGANSESVQDVGIGRVGAAVLGVTDGFSGGAAIRFTEMTAPSAPAANTVVLYAQDNGSGKTQLMARFPTGAAQQVAIEP